MDLTSLRAVLAEWRPLLVPSRFEKVQQGSSLVHGSILVSGSRARHPGSAGGVWRLGFATAGREDRSVRRPSRSSSSAEPSYGVLEDLEAFLSGLLLRLQVTRV